MRVSSIRMGAEGGAHTNDLRLSSPACRGSPVYPALCNFKASCWSGVNRRYVRARGLTHVDDGGYECVNVRPSRISLDHTGRETLGRAGLGARICECGERLFGVNQACIDQLWSDMREGSLH